MRANASIFMSGLALLLIGCDSNTVPVGGTVISVAYKCRFDIKRDDPIVDRARSGDRPSEEELFGDCSGDPDFARARADFDNFKTRFSGKATVRVSYVSPIDDSTVDSELEFDGDDREFYTLRVGSPVNLSVNKSDHSQISFAG